MTPGMYFAYGYARGRGDSDYMARLFATWALPHDEVDPLPIDNVAVWVDQRYAVWTHEN